MAVIRKTWGTGNRVWLGSNHSIENAQTGTVDISTFTAGTHYPDGYLPSGTRVNTANLQRLKPWTAAVGERLGFLIDDHPINTEASAAEEDFSAAYIWHGRIKTALLPAPAFTAPAEPGMFEFITGVNP